MPKEDFVQKFIDYNLALTNSFHMNRNLNKIQDEINIKNNEIEKYEKKHIQEFLIHLLFKEIRTINNLIDFLDELLNSISDIIDNDNRYDLQSINSNEILNKNDLNIPMCLKMDGFEKLKLEELLNKFLVIECSEIKNSTYNVNNLLTFVKQNISDIYSTIKFYPKLDENEIDNFCSDYFKERNISEFVDFIKKEIDF